MKLSIELVPRTSFYKNLRSELKRSEWDILRRECYKKAMYRCEICNSVGLKHPVECHEVWEYETLSNKDKVYKQTLKGLIALCPSCHQVKHIGKARMIGRYDQALDHFIRVNQISDKACRDYMIQIFELWHKRSERVWKIDISWSDNKL